MFTAAAILGLFKDQSPKRRPGVSIGELDTTDLKNLSKTRLKSVYRSMKQQDNRATMQKRSRQRNRGLKKSGHR
jgi:hypothetical protein